MSKKLTLCLIYDHSKLLLGLKKRGFGQGRWNGFGGKVREKETIEEAAKREVMEEIGIKIEKIEKKGILDFEFQDAQESLQTHIFHATRFSGNPIESEEMKPRWFGIEEIPFKKMWSDDEYWLPLFLKGKKFKGKFLFDSAKSNKIISSELKEVEEI